jgi:serine/threonine protein kinase/CheY-like chemotaxis protein
MDGSLTVVIVGPEPSVVQALRDLLRRDYRVLSAASIPGALALLQTQSIHLVLADHQPPGMNGMAFLRQIRRDHPEVLRFLFSSSADPWVASAAASQGHDFRYIRQPWDAEELQTFIRQAVEEHQRPGDLGPAPERRRSLAPGAHLGQYQLLERLGQGGMGTVYKAVHGLLKREVAVKVLPAEYMSDAQAIARFRREMEAVGRLHHPHIVQASDANEVDGTHFLVMEYVEGLDLAQVVARHGPLPVPEACAIIHQALAGLQHAYEQNLVHRDLKPANLMLTPQGQVKVLDFGLALLYDEPSPHEDLAPGGRVAGTADYLAPEVVRGPQPVDTRSDIYSLGCTLYELLAGRPPFSGADYATVRQKLLAHVQAPLPPIREGRPEVSEALAIVLNWFLAKDPAGRFGKPATAAAALEPFRRGARLGRLFASLPQGPLQVQPTEDYLPRDLG